MYMYDIFISIANLLDMNFQKHICVKRLNIFEN